MDDGLGARLVQQRLDGRRAVEVGRDRARAGGWGGLAMGGGDVEAALVEERREAAAQEPARAGDQDAKRAAHPVMTAPPFTDRICPCR